MSVSGKSMHIRLPQITKRLDPQIANRLSFTIAESPQIFGFAICGGLIYGPSTFDVITLKNS